MLYKDYDWLYSNYVQERLSSRLIAQECGATHHTILNWLKKFGIERRSISEANSGKVRALGIREKQSRRMVEYHKTHTHHFLGKNRKLEVRMKIAKTNKEKGIRPSPPIGRVCTEETRRKRSAAFQGLSLDEWNGYTSFEPYCSLFNIELKEKIRNRDNRVCVLCGKSEILNGARLSVHHIDGDKMQGCNGKKWHLVALCKSCNSKSDTLEKEFLLVARSRGFDKWMKRT